MAKVDPRTVFINAPFDAQYEPLFVTLVGTLVSLGQKPHCVLEVRESGQGRLARIFQVIQDCRMSFHDVSRVNTPVRFNMPFELGLACAVNLMSGGAHEVFVLDAAPYRLDRTLSDYKGRDPLVHYNRCEDMIGCVLDVFQPASLPSPDELGRAARDLRRTARQLKRGYKLQSVFRPAIFKALIAAATEIAVDRGLINP
jgi:hypothetical protein